MTGYLDYNKKIVFLTYRLHFKQQMKAQMLLPRWMIEINQVVGDVPRGTVLRLLPFKLFMNKIPIGFEESKATLRVFPHAGWRKLPTTAHFLPKPTLRLSISRCWIRHLAHLRVTPTEVQGELAKIETHKSFWPDELHHKPIKEPVLMIVDPSMKYSISR